MGYDGYEDRFEDHMLDLYRALQAEVNGTSSQDPTSPDYDPIPTFEDFASVPDTISRSENLYMVGDNQDEVRRQQIWWSTAVYNKYGADAEGYTPPAWNDLDGMFLGLPYLPFFSNCKGSDNHISLSKAFETDPMCDRIAYENTIEVNAYPWNDQMVPNADKCYSLTPDELTSRVSNTRFAARKFLITLLTSFSFMPTCKFIMLHADLYGRGNRLA